MVRPGRLVLIVDRDLDFVEDLRVLLRDHRALAARSMSEAVEILVGGRVDVVVLGPSFGSEAGVRGAADIFDADPDVSVVLVANIVTNRVLRAALQIGLVDVVDTPVTLRKLAEAFDRAGDREGGSNPQSRSKAVTQRSEVRPIERAHADTVADAVAVETAAAETGSAWMSIDAVEPAPVVAPSRPQADVGRPQANVGRPQANVEGVELVFGGAATDTRVMRFDSSSAPVAVPTPSDLHMAFDRQSTPQPRPALVEEPTQSVTPVTFERAAAPTAPEPVVTPSPMPPPMPPPAPPTVQVTSAPTPPSAAPPMPQAVPQTHQPVAAAPIEAPPVHRPLPSRGSDAPRVAVERPQPRTLSGSGRVITVTSGKAGSGKTVTATNVAAAMCERLGPDRVVIVDADTQFGDVALLLQLEPSRTVTEAVETIDSLSDARLDAMLLRHDSGLRVLPAPLLPLPPESVSIPGLIAVIERLKRMYAVVVVDTSPIFGPTLLSLLDHSDTVLMVVDMDLPSVKNAKIAIDTLRNDGYPEERLHLVVNRVNSKARLDLVELERSLGLRVSGSIPSDRIVPQSVNEGVPVVLLSPRSRVAKSFHSLAERFGPDRARRAS